MTKSNRKTKPQAATSAKSHQKPGKKKAPNHAASVVVAHKSEQKRIKTGSKVWPRLYAGLCLLVLLGSSVVWSVLGARVQQGNADQLIDTFLVQDWHTFQGALFPSAHTFLLKWPLFWIVHLYGSSVTAVETSTVILTLLTVGSLAYILYRIERRPLVWGTILLALASVFVLVPAQPYAGGLLPVNMAMLTTRNIEYIVYIVGLAALVRWPRVKQPGLWAGVILLGILVTSDRLFLTISLGGAVISSVVYALTHHRAMVRLTLRWLCVTLAAGLFSAAVIWTITASGLTHISAQGDSPFTLARHPKDIALGIVFGMLGILTNFGANPAFDAAEFKNIPHLLHERLMHVSGIGFVINAVLLLIGMYAVLRLLWRSVRVEKLDRKTAESVHFDRPEQLSLLLIWSSLAAIGAFVVTDHYYVVDARYLSILLFAAAISGATFLRTRMIPAKWLYIIGVVLVCSTGLGFGSAIHTYHDERQALQSVDARTALITAALKHQSVHVVVGDYWRVVPLKQRLPADTILPLSSCLLPQHILSSSAWHVDLKRQSFAYLLSFDKSLTNYSNCNLQMILSHYGLPNSSVLIAGHINQPQEVLLFYTHQQARPAQKASPKQATASILPTNLADYPHLTCPAQSTVMNIVAHQDDDLLFLSPDLLHAIQAGSCVRTVYVTAGDSGNGQLYWLSRERGSEAAYDTMLHNTAPWVQRTVKLADKSFVTIANPQSNRFVSLIFMHLPDGNVRGQGFAVSHYESLAHLIEGSIPAIYSVDDQSHYSLPELTSALTRMIDAFQPTEIYTQAPYNESMAYPDHSDHISVGHITSLAYENRTYLTPVSIRYYVGYPIRTQKFNIAPKDLEAKITAFLAYARFDGAVCQSNDQCASMMSYGNYLRHEYTTATYQEEKLTP